jgi:hypothetical protein
MMELARKPSALAADLMKKHGQTAYERLEARRNAQKGFE